jgi:hypothetical protein
VVTLSTVPFHFLFVTLKKKSNDLELKAAANKLSRKL